MANVAVSVTQSLTQHAFRLLGVADLKVLIVVEDPNGNRLWSANGKLRSEFVHEKKVENRSWGMEELMFEDGPKKLDDAKVAVEEVEDRVDREEAASVEVAKEIGGAGGGASSVIYDVYQEVPPPASLASNGGQSGASRRCMHCGADHASLDCPKLNVCPSCGEMGHSVTECSNVFKKNPIPVGDPASVTCMKCGKRGHIAALCLASSCFKCGGKDHLSAECRIDAGRGSGGAVGGGSSEPAALSYPASLTVGSACEKCKSTVHRTPQCPLCVKCKEFGHRAFNCPYCIMCGKKGHKGPDCPGSQGPSKPADASVTAAVAAAAKGAKAAAAKAAAAKAAAAPPPAKPSSNNARRRLGRK